MSKCMITCSFASGRACVLGLYLHVRNLKACTPLGCRMICSAGPVVSMTSRSGLCVHLCAEKLAGLPPSACASSSVSSIIVPSVGSIRNTQAHRLKLQSLHVLSSPENAPGLPTRVSRIPCPTARGGGSVAPDGCCIQLYSESF